MGRGGEQGGVLGCEGMEGWVVLAAAGQRRWRWLETTVSNCDWCSHKRPLEADGQNAMQRTTQCQAKPMTRVNPIPVVREMPCSAHRGVMGFLSSSVTLQVPGLPGAASLVLDPLDWREHASRLSIGEAAAPPNRLALSARLSSSVSSCSSPRRAAAMNDNSQNPCYLLHD